jgi:hypothetical protein
MDKSKPPRYRKTMIERTLGHDWLRQLARRLRTLWPVKACGTAFGMTLFFVAYFRLLHHPLFPVTTIPLIAVDRWIGFQPAALPLYLSLWVYVSLAPALLLDRREIACYLAAITALSLVGFGIFLFWPTAVPATSINWSQHPSLAFLKAADAAGNACPSLHVAFAVFTSLWLARILHETGTGRPVRILNGAWCLGIVYSTLAIRQHVALDALAGAVLGGMIAAFAQGLLRAWPRRGLPR